YEADVASIEHIFGRSHEKVRLGDEVPIKATHYKPPLYLDARVIFIERKLSDPSKKKFLLGDFIEYTEADVKKISKDLQKLIAQKIGEARLVEYAEKVIPEQDNPPDPVEHPKWVDTSKNPPQLMLWNGEEWTTVKGEKGDPGKDGKDGYTPIKGVDYFDGIDGKDGADGSSSYLWVKYSQNANGNPMTDNPLGAL